MARFEKSLKALESPDNEPLNWLAGDALRQHAELAAGSHFLLNALGQPRTGTLTAWNARIHEFRDLLTNPDTAPKKATADLRPDKKGAVDAEDRLRSLIAEVQAPIVLTRLGFTRFSVVLPGESALPDFEAEFEGKQARIEVKNLREPQDLLGNVASDQWAKRRTGAPGRYNFNAVLSGTDRGCTRVA
jgi:hypothetical protein